MAIPRNHSVLFAICGTESSNGCGSRDKSLRIFSYLLSVSELQSPSDFGYTRMPSQVGDNGNRIKKEILILVACVLLGFGPLDNTRNFVARFQPESWREVCEVREFDL